MIQSYLHDPALSSSADLISRSIASYFDHQWSIRSFCLRRFGLTSDMNTCSLQSIQGNASKGKRTGWERMLCFMYVNLDKLPQSSASVKGMTAFLPWRSCQGVIALHTSSYLACHACLLLTM